MLAARREAVAGRAESRGGALQVFPATRESWQQKSVFVFISLKKKKTGKRTPELVICKSWMRNLEAAGSASLKAVKFLSPALGGTLNLPLGPEQSPSASYYLPMKLPPRPRSRAFREFCLQPRC